MARPVYITIEDLRRVVPDTTTYPDVVLQDLIEVACDLVECLTDQVFGPTQLAVTVNGWGRRAAAHTKSWKIIEVDEVRCLDTNQSTQPFPYSVVDRGLYAVHDRCVRLRTVDKRHDTFQRALYALPERRFPYDDKNVTVAAVWGDIDLDVKFVTELAVALAKGDTQVHLLDTSDLSKHDTLMIGPFWVIVKEIVVPSDVANNVVGVVSIDPSCFKADLGSEVVRYGAVHRLIREAVVRTAAARRFLPGSEEELEVESSRRIKREETDNYEIEFFQGNSGGSAGGPGFWTGTGDPIADSILSKFRAGLVQGRWV